MDLKNHVLSDTYSGFIKRVLWKLNMAFHHRKDCMWEKQVLWPWLIICIWMQFSDHLCVIYCVNYWGTLIMCVPPSWLKRMMLLGLLYYVPMNQCLKHVGRNLGNVENLSNKLIRGFCMWKGCFLINVVKSVKPRNLCSCKTVCLWKKRTEAQKEHIVI